MSISFIMNRNWKQNVNENWIDKYWYDEVKKDDFNEET